jgi:hypothetical protein
VKQGTEPNFVKIGAINGTNEGAREEQREEFEVEVHSIYRGADRASSWPSCTRSERRSTAWRSPPTACLILDAGIPQPGDQRRRARRRHLRRHQHLPGQRRTGLTRPDSNDARRPAIAGLFFEQGEDNGY